MNAVLLLICCLFVILHAVQAAEWSKLKRCADLGFCRRHRHFSAAAHLLYKVSRDTLKLTNWNGQSAFIGSLATPSRHPLFFVVTAFANGIYRVAFDDNLPTNHQRYTVKDIIQPHVKPVALQKELLYEDLNHAELLIQNFTTKVILYYDPFRIDIVRVGDDIVLASFNSQSRLLVEAFAEKPTPSPSPSPSDAENARNVESAGDSQQHRDGSPSTTGKDAESRELDDGENADLYDDDSSDDVDPENGDGTSPAAAADEACVGCWEEKFQSHHDPKLRGPESIGVDIAFPFARFLYGLPERTTKFALEDTVGDDKEEISEPYRMYNLDVFEFELDKPLGLYGSIPFLMARSGHDSAGMLWLNSAETYVDVTKSPEDQGKNTHWYSETGKVDVFFMPGPTASHIYRQYFWLTGKPAIPQRFALGYHQSRWNYRDEEDSKAVDAEFDKRGIPYDVLWLDIEHTDGKRYFTWDTERFPNPTELQNHIAARGRKVVTIIDPHVKRDNKYRLHRLAQDEKLYVTKPDGKPYDGWCWPGSSSYFDVTCPRVRAAWAGFFNPTDYPHFTKHLYTWNDMNEPSVFNGPEGTMPKDMIHVGNVEHRHVHNIYGHYFMQATFEGLLKGHGGNDRPFVLSRSFFAGSQKYGAIWTGDNTAAWDHLESTVRMLLPLQISGMIFSGADVGGFFGNPSAELITRWYQAAAFQPFFRGHAHLDTNRREPWIFEEPFATHIAEAIRMRYNFIPFWYTLFAESALDSDVGFNEDSTGPPMRPLWWEFPTDAGSQTNQRQWMVGNALLVSPVVEEGVSTHKMYVPPEEVWYDLFAPASKGKPFEKNGEVDLPVTIDSILVFQRGGTIIPQQERRRRSTVAMKEDPYTLVVALSKEKTAKGDLYMDDGQSYDHQSGSYSLRRFRYRGSEMTAETVSGGEKDFVGKKSSVERIVILGYGEREPKRIVVGTRQLDFSLARETGVLTVQRVQLGAGEGDWKLSIEE